MCFVFCVCVLCLCFVEACMYLVNGPKEDRWTREETYCRVMEGFGSVAIPFNISPLLIRKSFGGFFEGFESCASVMIFLNVDFLRGPSLPFKEDISWFGTF